MRRVLLTAACLSILLALFLSLAATASAEGPQWIVVNPGDTLSLIAGRYGITIDALVRANNLPNPSFVYSGQRLLIPQTIMLLSNEPIPVLPNAAPYSAPRPVVANHVYYTVSPGDSLAAIAQRYGVSVAAIAEANNLTNWNFVWYGQRLLIPGTSQVTGVKPPAPQPVPVLAPQPASGEPIPVLTEKVVPAGPLPANAPTSGKWIDINVTNQTITAYDGLMPLKTVVVSTGVSRTPTVLGTYKIIRKHETMRMTGGTPGIDYYDLPNVPFSMFFYQGYAIHGTYWHTNFGTPMSHGCVNLPTDEANWFYEWAPMGTLVISHK